MKMTPKKRQKLKAYIVIWSIIGAIFLVGFFTGLLVHALSWHTAALSTDEVSTLIEEESAVTEPPVESESVSEEIFAVSETTQPEPEYISFKATAYCGCSKCCGKWAEINRPDGKVIGAAGVKLKEGVSIAADLSVLPKGTVVEIKDLGIYIVQDTGGAVKGNSIDIYFENHEDALKFGVQQVLLRVVDGYEKSPY